MRSIRVESMCDTGQWYTMEPFRDGVRPAFVGVESKNPDCRCLGRSKRSLGFSPPPTGKTQRIHAAEGTRFHVRLIRIRVFSYDALPRFDVVYVWLEIKETREPFGRDMI